MLKNKSIYLAAGEADLSVHDGGCLGAQGVVDGDGVAQHAAAVPHRVKLPLAHRQVCREEGDDANDSCLAPSIQYSISFI